MTIRHSSSRRGTTASPTTLLDSISRQVHLGAEVGRGGEGSVYQVLGDETLVAKIYHKRPMPADQVAKLQAMSARWNTALEAISAWPRSLLYDPSSRMPWGILMSRMAGARALHELYGTTHRRHYFPDVGWHHLLLAARNTAAAFQTLGNSGVIVGDVNQGNLLVDEKMCVRLIDCDSFQFTDGDRTFNCPVGTPHFTPPELQNVRLREVSRTQNHDRFGMAVLIFHLLFVGRHPFAGRYRGPTDMPIEKAIAERRFAFSRNTAETLMEPPPASLVLDEVSPAVADLFERAFRYTEGSGSERPSPVEWVEQLDAMIRQRKTCQFDSVHVYYGPVGDCPWCRIEDAGGPSFFVSAQGSAASADRLIALDGKINDLPVVEFAELPADRLALPHLPPPTPDRKRIKRSIADAAAILLPASWITCLAGAFYGSVLVAVGAALSLVLAAVLITNKQARARRKTRSDHQAVINDGTEKLLRRANKVRAQHRQREMAFRRAAEELQTQIAHYRAEENELKDVFIHYRELKKEEFLRGYSIRDNYRIIGGLNQSQVAILESYGIETANDLDRLRLYGIPSIDSEAVMELLQWRTQVDRQFVFNPEHGVTLADLATSKEAAIRRFKIVQARKILSTAKQVENLASNAKLDLDYAVSSYETATEKWKAAAQQMVDYQASRPRLERWINRSPRRILGLSIGIPLIAVLVHLAVR
jgi:DNA-binding helix-hairpin-helix protein with protein kinase domain